MKNITLLVLISAISSACNQDNGENNISGKGGKDEVEWKEQFKNLVLCNCVITAMGDSSIKAKFELNDKSFYNPINFVMKEDIKQILTPVISTIKKDSILSITTVGEGAQGKKVFNHCLEYYKSKELDSLADKKFVKWKHTNIDSAMSDTSY